MEQGDNGSAGDRQLSTPTNLGEGETSGRETSTTNPSNPPSEQQQQSVAISNFSDSSNNNSSGIQGLPMLEQQIFEGLEQAWQQNRGGEAQRNINAPPQPSLAPMAGASFPTPPLPGTEGGQQQQALLQMFQHWLSIQQQSGSPQVQQARHTSSSSHPPFGMPTFQPQQQQQPQFTTQFQAPAGGSAESSIADALTATFQQAMAEQQQQQQQSTPAVPQYGQQSTATPSTPPNPASMQQLLQALAQAAQPNNPNALSASYSTMPSWGYPQQNPLPGGMMASAPSTTNTSSIQAQINQFWAQQQQQIQPSFASPQASSGQQMQNIILQLLQQLLSGGGMYAPPQQPQQQQQQYPAHQGGNAHSPDMNAILPVFLQLLLSSFHQPHSYPAPTMSSNFVPSFPFTQPFVPFAQGVAVASSPPAGFASANIGASAEASAGQSATPKKKRKYSHEAFPQKLHRLITEAAENEEEREAVHWTEDGTRFKIADTSGFEKILPRYFRHGNISSFKRLLHMYDFKRIMGKIIATTSSFVVRKGASSYTHLF
eukprot:scaffold575_cov186-Amphora_coffeaeformis.AAC.5